MAAVSYKNIGKSFDNGAPAVTDFNLDIKDGELMVLVGPSGCGKSTLLRILAGLETASQGEILIAGEVVNDKTAQQRNVAMVFQNYALYPHMTVRRNIEFPLKMMKLAKAEIKRRVDATAKLLELDMMLERKPKQLSGGQRQRVAMGRAMVREPAVFLMDEPLSNLDAKLRVQIRAEISALQRRMNTTTLYVTHDQVEAMTLGDRVAVINQGCLQQVADPQALYEQPANIFVAGFIGNPGMNVFKTELHSEHDQLTIRWGQQQLSLSLDVKRKEALQRYICKPIFAGLRPEAISCEDTQNVDATITVEVESIEALGHEYLLYFKSDVVAVDTDRFLSDGEITMRSIMVARLAGRVDAKAGEKIELGLMLKQLYFFDEGGMAVL